MERALPHALCASLFLLGAAPALADPTFDADRAQAIAAELAKIVEGVDEGARAAPAGLTAAQASDRAHAVRSLGELKRNTAALATRLSSGEGRQATVESVREIRRLRDDAFRTGRRSGVTNANLTRMVQAEKLLSALESYYEEEH